MNSDKEANYLSTYQYNHFQITPGDSYKTADIERQCLAQTIKACHTLDKDSLANTILETKLNECCELVDDHFGVNNYVATIKNISSNVSESHCLQWKNGLKVEDFDSLIKSLNCCSSTEVPRKEVDSFFQKKSPTNTELQITNAKKQNSLINVIPSTSHSSNRNQFQKFTKKPEVNGQNSQKYEENISNPTVKRNNHSVFKSARDELEVQNAKKYKSNPNSNQQTYSYGTQKKSLGGRSRGVQSKFIPPMKVEPNDQNSPTWESEEVVDERLKNIDPKMIELIRSEIMDSGAPIAWDDIAGLEFAKTVIKEVVVWPLLRPDIFTGLRRPPKGILLFGPPGTGKTLIGKCIASQSQSTFFSISASSLTSKWIGDGEKMVRAMFAVARCHQPAVIFIDEIDSLLSQRSDTEHECSRRIKTEFLVQLDGAATGEEDRILVIGATNRPQELDEAARRRFVKRLYIPLPEKSARLEIVKRLMNNERNELTEENIIEIANLADGYSGADMKSLCSEASLGPIRSIDINMIQNIQADQVRPITMQDFRSALIRVRSSVSPGDLEQYVTWDRTYGAGGW